MDHMEICYSFKVSGFDRKTVCGAAEVTWSAITAADHQTLSIIFNWYVGMYISARKKS
jgi:hypothetical protein